MDRTDKKELKKKGLKGFIALEKRDIKEAKAKGKGKAKPKKAKKKGK